MSVDELSGMQAETHSILGSFADVPRTLDDLHNQGGPLTLESVYIYMYNILTITWYIINK